VFRTVPAAFPSASAVDAYKAAKAALEEAKEQWLDSLRRFNGKPATTADPPRESSAPVAIELPSELPPVSTLHFAGSATS
jgi:hypothetical protein